MKLLDRPISKTAALSDKAAIMQALVAAGTGGAAGVLGEMMLTGKVGWRGATIGAATGLGTTAALDKDFRNKIVGALQGKPTGTDAQEQVDSEQAEQSDEPTDEQRLSYYRSILAAEDNRGVPPDVVEEIREKVAGWDRYQAAQTMATSLGKDPRYKSVMAHASDGKDATDYLAHYATAYEEAKGKLPTPEHLYRFTEATKVMQLQPGEWGSYMDDTHQLSGVEEGSFKQQVLPQLLAGTMPTRRIGQIAGKYMPQTAKQAKYMAEGVDKGTAILRANGGVYSWYNPKTWGKKVWGAEGRVLKALTKKHGAKNAGKMMLKRQAAKKLLARRVVGPGVRLGYKRIATKGLGKAVPVLGSMVDATELLIDPRTGKYDFDPRNMGRNIAEQDRLMELRERHDTMPFGTGDRNVLYNMGLGGLRGAVNQATTLAVAGHRMGDIGAEGIDAVKRGGAKGALRHMQSQAGALVGQTWGAAHDAATDTEINDYRRSIGKPPLRRIR